MMNAPMRQTANNPTTAKRAVAGWFFTITGFLACPCHLVITIPLAVALFSGTAAGGWIAAHTGAIAMGASIYFVGGLAVGALLMTSPFWRSGHVERLTTTGSDDR